MTTDLNQLAAPQKRQLLAELLQKGLLQPKDRPLSIGQERLHRLAVLYADVPLYNVAVAYRIKGLLDIEATEKAVRRIAERHEILRTTFPLVDGKPVQRIAPPQNYSAIFVQFDLGVASDADRPGRVAQVIGSSENARIAKSPRQTPHHA